MKNEKMKSLVEYHVCQHEDCAEKGSKELRDKLKKWAKEHHGKDIKVFRSGCLGKCSEGMAIACYPERKFILEVKLSDSKEIKEMMEESIAQAKRLS